MIDYVILFPCCRTDVSRAAALDIAQCVYAQRVPVETVITDMADALTVVSSISAILASCVWLHIYWVSVAVSEEPSA